MPNFLITGNSPITTSKNNNEIFVKLNETNVLSTPSVDTEIFNGNINELKIDKYGRIHSVTTGYNLPTPNQINYLRISGNDNINKDIKVTDVNNNDTLKFEGYGDHLTTEIDETNNKIIYKLNKTGINDKEIKTIDITTTNGQVLIYDKYTQNWSNNITLYKGKEYIFRQKWENSILQNNNPLPYSFNISTNDDYMTDNSYNNGIDFYIKKNATNVILGPFNYADYHNEYINRSENDDGLIYLTIPNDNANTSLYGYIYGYPSVFTSLLINIINTNNEYILYQNITGLTIDAYGRINDLKTTNNNKNLMTEFETQTDDNIIKKTHNNEILKLTGVGSHIRSFTKNDEIVFRLENIDISNIDNNFDNIINYQFNYIDDKICITDNTNNIYNINIYRERFYKFFLKTELNNFSLINISINNINTHTIYDNNLEYYIINSNNEEIKLNFNDFKIAIDANNYGGNSIIKAYLLFWPVVETPNILYIFNPNNPSQFEEFTLNIIDDYISYNNISQIKVDRFGRIRSILTDNIDSSAIGDGSVDNVKFQYLKNVNSDLQNQLNLLNSRIIALENNI